MAVCEYPLFSLIPSCEALHKPGGARREYYIAQRASFTYTTAANGAMATLTMLTGKFLIKGIGRKLTNIGLSDLQRNDNGTLFYAHAVKVAIPAITQAERNAVEALVGPDNLVVFVPLNSGAILIYGLNSGLEISKLGETTGAKLGDGSDFMAEITGQEPHLPILFEPTAAATLPTRLLLLEAATSPNPDPAPPPAN